MLQKAIVIFLTIINTINGHLLLNINILNEEAIMVGPAEVSYHGYVEI